MTTRYAIPTPSDFAFWPTVTSHGWCELAPFEYDREQRSLAFTFSLPSHAIANCHLAEGDGHLNVSLLTATRLTPGDRGKATSLIRSVVRLEEDFSQFHREVRRDIRFAWIARRKAGRLLRAPTVFEDVVKMVCTTNCTWGVTTLMVRKLVTQLGTSGIDGCRAFPGPEAIARASDSFLRKRCSTGYRSPYILALARDIARGRLDVESWRTTAMPTPDLYRAVLALPGVGPYAAGNIMKLLGRYDYLGLDSWVRKKYAQLHARGRAVNDSAIERAYRPFGRWRGLIFWLDMTRDWHDEKFPSS